MTSQVVTSSPLAPPRAAVVRQLTLPAFQQLTRPALKQVARPDLTISQQLLSRSRLQPAGATPPSLAALQPVQIIRQPVFATWQQASQQQIRHSATAGPTAQAIRHVVALSTAPQAPSGQLVRPPPLQPFQSIQQRPAAATTGRPQLVAICSRQAGPQLASYASVAQVRSDLLHRGVQIAQPPHSLSQLVRPVVVDHQPPPVAVLLPPRTTAEFVTPGPPLLPSSPLPRFNSQLLDQSSVLQGKATDFYSAQGCPPTVQIVKRPFNIAFPTIATLADGGSRLTWQQVSGSSASPVKIIRLSTPAPAFSSAGENIRVVGVGGGGCVAQPPRSILMKTTSQASQSLPRFVLPPWQSIQQRPGAAASQVIFGVGQERPVQQPPTTVSLMPLHVLAASPPLTGLPENQQSFVSTIPAGVRFVTAGAAAVPSSGLAFRPPEPVCSSADPTADFLARVNLRHRADSSSTQRWPEQQQAPPPAVIVSQKGTIIARQNTTACHKAVVTVAGQKKEAVIARQKAATVGLRTGYEKSERAAAERTKCVGR